MTDTLDPDALADVAASIARREDIVFLTGAGLSVASGIAPYRKSKDAVWSRLVTEWATLERFSDDPLAWWREFWLKAHGSDLHEKVPNAGHHAITSIIKGRPGARVITQNIDGLHRKAGVSEEQLIEIHGRHDRFVCTRAGCVHVHDALVQVDLSGIERSEIPLCPACGAALRPLVLLFDELYDSHPAYRMRDARCALDDAAVLIFVGTSFSVGITDYAVRAGTVGGARIVNINVDPEPRARFLNLVGPAEVVLPALAQAVDTHAHR